jgi:hypothetical protein
VRFWRQEADDLVLFASVGGLRSPELGLIPIFQTVSEGEFSEVAPSMNLSLQWHEHFGGERSERR